MQVLLASVLRETLSLGLRQSKTFRRGEAEGFYAATVAPALDQYVQRRGATLVQTQVHYWGTTRDALYCWPSGYVYFQSSNRAEKLLPPTANETSYDASSADEHGDVWVDLKYGSIDDNDVRDLLLLLREHPRPKRPPKKHKNPGHAYVLGATITGPQIMAVGVAGKALEPSNYAPEAVEQYKRAVSDIKAASPIGRLSIFEGPPGTGKTHMVRALMQKCDQARFVFVAPELLPKLSDPIFVRTFMNEMNGPGPVVLVLEDADACLAARTSGNMPSIAAVLNLSDGVLGALFDLRILATTNARHGEFDPAVLRAGRLSAHVKIEPLELTQAMTVWERIAAGAPYPFLDTGAKTLGELYEAKAEL